MVIVNFGNGVTDMRGSAAGNTWSKNASGPYMKKKSSPVNQMTAAQLARRSAMSNITQVGNDLSIGLKQAWSNYAAQNPVTNRFGNPTVLTWLQMFNKVNGILVLVGEPIKNTPPPNVEVELLNFALNQIALSAGEGSPADCEWEFTPTPSSANTKIIGYATPPLNPGLINVNNLYRFIGHSAAASISEFNPQTDANLGGYFTGSVVSSRVATVDIRNGKQSQFVEATFTIV